MSRRSRIRSAAAALDRRTFLTATGAVGAATGLGLAFGPGGGSATASPPAAPGAAESLGAAARAVPAVPAAASKAGTTLASVAAPRGAGPFRRLGDGPGWPRQTRTDLAAAKKGRADRRTTVASFVQFTDLHLTDVQHPLRYEFFRAGNTGSWRPHEALTMPGVVSLIERVNALRTGPATGTPLSFVMTTGDNGDNNSKAELDWFLTAMAGGRITPNTGHPSHYEGVQNSGLKLFWNPESTLRDADKQQGFPHLPGYLAAATRTVNSPGLAVPWYSTYGNHDGLSGGCYPGVGSFIADVATGDRKLQSIGAAEAKRILDGEAGGVDPKGKHIEELLRAHRKDMRTITPDPRRAPTTTRDYLAAHLDPAHTGAGPVGHGYGKANLDAGTLYYSFKISDRVIGISLDSTDPGGHYQGSLGTAQLRWLERTLNEHKDQYALVFSHHPSWSMNNTTPDPARPGEARHEGDELIAVLRRHRNVLAWINGHSHKNKIAPRGTFWEISTASHVDYPQLARVIEVTDNHDGTVSLFTTLIESAAPHRTDFHDLSQTGLAALYRELAFNAPGASTGLAGTLGDRNTELLLPRR
ncbi:TIGR03767 family metallophosphoesterase [Streptomyces sp. NPDC050610]|uniref:TIGR03767 family metallophosphoesterase n=1 Tax=Streptomyces sp. NPDC050610 TaxID=3157097 RepID=UPI0034414314